MALQPRTGSRTIDHRQSGVLEGLKLATEGSRVSTEMEPGGNAFSRFWLILRTAVISRRERARHFIHEALSRLVSGPAVTFISG